MKIDVGAESAILCRMNSSLKRETLRLGILLTIFLPILPINTMVSGCVKSN